MKGQIRAALFDLRPNSPTFKQAQTIDLNADNRTGLFIPIGVAHGFAGLSDRLILTYVVDNYYDSSDEFGIKWNDPALGIDWGVKDAIVSGRDAANPLFNDIPIDRLPKF
jgi:dTDP-4-dehydrorhamnose 3,5-epimerase